MNPIAKRFYKSAADKWASAAPEVVWRLLLTGEAPALREYRDFLKRLPSDPRCKLCNAPFVGLGAPLMRLIGKGQSKLNPRLCGTCFDTSPLGGAEIELTMLFADVRGSTGLAEQMSTAEFSRLINRFYVTAVNVLAHTDALIDRLIGDAVIGLYIPGLAGPEHSRLAVQAGRQLLEAVGYGGPGGPWLRVGVGVHTGTAFVGKVGTGSVTDITVLGDAANLTARLASSAGPGEVLISDAAYHAARLKPDGLEQRTVEIKGRSEPAAVWVQRAISDEGRKANDESP